MSKKNVRAEFRHACYERDDHCCAMCGWKPSKEAWASYYEHPQQIPSAAPLDAHHVTDRTLMPWGGYVKENGISLCSQCHGFAEQYHITGKAHPGYSPTDLYNRIKSNYTLAVLCSLELEDGVGYEDVMSFYQSLYAIKTKEQEIAKNLGDIDLDANTWELACEQCDVRLNSMATDFDKQLLLYGKGRYI